MLHDEIAAAAPPPAADRPAADPADADPAEPEPQQAARATYLKGLAAEFERVSRGIRRTILLATKLAEPPPPPPAPFDRVGARKRIIRAVEDRIHHQIRSEPERDRLAAELAERLDSPDLENDLPKRPTNEIIAEITRDLGLDAMAAHWKRRTPDVVADLCAFAAKPPRPPDAAADPAPAPPPVPQAVPHPDPERLYRLLAPDHA